MNKNPCDTCKNFSEQIDSTEYENEQLVERVDSLENALDKTLTWACEKDQCSEDFYDDIKAILDN